MFSRLKEGLLWLRDWGGVEFSKLKCPLSIHASEGDKIVPIVESRKMWGGYPEYYEIHTNSHILPASMPKILC